MPTYEYACTSCGNEWEAEQSIKEAPLTDCPACQKATARRQISRSGGFILKGGGWYSDLYSSSSNKKPEGADKPADKAGSGDKAAADKGSGGDKAAADKGGGDKGSSGSSTPDTSSGSSSSGGSSKPSTGGSSTTAS